MDSQSVASDAFRKRKEREIETVERREERLQKDRQKKQKKLEMEGEEEREERLTYQREKSRQRRKKKKDEQRANGGGNDMQQKLDDNEQQRLNNSNNTQMRFENMTNYNGICQRVEQSRNATEIDDYDRIALEKFRDKMDKLENVVCLTCNESSPSIVLVQGKCRRCYAEKVMPNKFSVENDMDPGIVPVELQGLTEIEEMLIARVFTVMSVYRLRGGQYGYRGNVINFPQNIQELATQLPRKPSSLEVLIVRRQSDGNLGEFRDFTVRRRIVARALQWLKANNRYYNDIHIDNEVLQNLPENGSIVEQLSQMHEEIDRDLNDAENEDDTVARSFVPSISRSIREDDAINETLGRLQSEKSRILWPHIENSPINEFQMPGYIAMAFPTLYPTGCADLRAGRIREVKPAEYFKHLLRYKDGRFGRHNRWRYFALNSQMRWRALQEGQIFVKQDLEDDELTVAEIQERIVTGDKYMADRIMHFGENLRGSRQFWNVRRGELLDMIKQLGSEGMVFFTFSAADLHWPELHKLMPTIENCEENDHMKNRNKNIIENPHTTACFFSKRFEIFFDNVLKPRWDLEDWWFRYEWQHRGSVHVHGIGKMRNGPKFEWTQLKENQNAVSELEEYFNSLVTTINPGLNDPIPGKHPCQKEHNELHDDIQDYVDLINKVQRHTRCSPSYCLRVDRSGQQNCRFGYPKETVERTRIQDDRGQPELITARNDPLINPHSRLQLQGWRGNVDFKSMLNARAALQYVSKYASKAEPRSSAFSEIYNQILCSSEPDDPCITSIQKLLLHSVSERDISAQETCHLLLGIPLYHSSRSVVSLNINKEAPRWVRGTGNTEISDDVGSTGQSALKKYWDRPMELENISLYQLNLRYKFVKGQWKECSKENIVRIWPRPSPIRHGPYWEEFCRVKVILHVKHRSIKQMTENGTISWSTLYEQHVEEINNGGDLLGPAIDNEEEVTTEEEEDFDDIQEDYDEHRPDWMILAEMVPNARIENSYNLGSRDMDRRHEWLNDGKQFYDNSEIMNVDNFLQRARENVRIEENGDDEDEVDYETLNEKQRLIFERIKTHHLSSDSSHPLRIIVMGTAGTGKTYLIRAIRQMINKITGTNDKTEVLVLAPTGVAAFNIRGKTIHSGLSIPIFNNTVNNVDIKGERLKQLQEKLKDVKYVIIDEKSMVGRRLLSLVDIRLRQAFPNHNNEPFGGRSIILFGDFGQIPPVLDLPMYAKDQRDPQSNDGIAAYRQFREVYKLDAIQRQSGKSEEQQQFRDILLCMREGESTIADWETLILRSEEKLTRVEKEKFAEATSIRPRWTDVDMVNMEKLRSLNCPVAKINAIHTGGTEAKNADSDMANGLEAQLLLAKGARIMLTVNLWTQGGLVNGSMGTVQDIIYGEQGPPNLPIVVFITFDQYEGSTINTLDGRKVVPIMPIRRSWESKSGIQCSRLQIPVCLAWAITTHKSQGLTLDKAKIDLGKQEFAAGLSFVAVSRVRALKDIMFHPFSFERLQRIKKCKRLQERKAEEERLLSIICDNGIGSR